MSLTKYFYWHFVAISLLVATAVCDISRDSFREKCLAFKPARHINNSTLTRQEFVTADTILDLSDNVPTCNRRSQVVKVDLCRIALQIPTSKRSSISFELWLPHEWEGNRYLATGNGGVDGCKSIAKFTQRC
jgi:feruloyl esterase